MVVMLQHGVGAAMWCWCYGVVSVLRCGVNATIWRRVLRQGGTKMVWHGSNGTNEGYLVEYETVWGGNMPRMCYDMVKILKIY